MPTSPHLTPITQYPKFCPDVGGLTEPAQGRAGVMAGRLPGSIVGAPLAGSLVIHDLSKEAKGLIGNRWAITAVSQVRIYGHKGSAAYAGAAGQSLAPGRAGCQDRSIS